MVYFNVQEIACLRINQVEITLRPEIRLTSLANNMEEEWLEVQNFLTLILNLEHHYDEPYNKYHNIYDSSLNTCLKISNPRSYFYFKISCFEFFFSFFSILLGNENEITNYLRINRDKVCSNLKCLDNTRDAGTRGILLLPSELDNVINGKLNINLFQNNLLVHMFCLNHEGNYLII